MIRAHSRHREAVTLALCCVVLGHCTRVQAAVLARGPYIQDLHATSATVVWVTDVASDSRVDYGLTSAYGSAVSDGSIVATHAVTLTGLSQGSIYHYQVQSDSTLLTGDLTFHSGRDETHTSYTFVAMGDHRTDIAAHTSVALAVKQIDPEIIIDVGDLTSNGDSAAAWDPEFFTPEKDVLSRSCIFPSIGNHEGTAANYLSYFYLPAGNSGTERYYSFDFGTAHFIALDNYTAYTTGTAQYNWLVSDLQANQSKMWKFVYLHKPPYSSGATHGSDLTVRDILCPLFEQYGVTMVFSGHDHCYERGYVNGVWYIVTGAGGAPLTGVGTNWWTVVSASTYEVVKISISGDLLNYEAVKTDGSTLDSFSSAVPVAVSHLELH